MCFQAHLFLTSIVLLHAYSRTHRGRLGWERAMAAAAGKRALAERPDDPPEMARAGPGQGPHRASSPSLGPDPAGPVRAPKNVPGPARAALHDPALNVHEWV
jgi:hypothetical protein